MRDVVKGINFLIKVMFYGAIGEVFAVGLKEVLAYPEIQNLIASFRAEVLSGEAPEKKKPEARKIGFVCEK